MNQHIPSQYDRKTAALLFKKMRKEVRDFFAYRIGNISSKEDLRQEFRLEKNEFAVLLQHKLAKQWVRLSSQQTHSGCHLKVRRALRIVRDDLALCVEGRAESVASLETIADYCGCSKISVNNWLMLWLTMKEKKLYRSMSHKPKQGDQGGEILPSDRFKSVLILVMERHGLMKKTLGEITGLCPEIISRWLRSKISPRLESIKMAYDALTAQDLLLPEEKTILERLMEGMKDRVVISASG